MGPNLRNFFFGTLRGRLILSVAAVQAAMMALFIFDLTVRQRAMLLARQAEEAEALAQSLSTSAAGWIASADVSGLQEIVEAQRRYPELIFAIITDNEGLVLANTDPSRRGLYMLDLPREARQITFSETPALVDVADPAILGGRHVGWVRVGIGQKASVKKLADITRNGVAYALVTILTGSAMAWLMGCWITRRLYAVQKTIDEVRSGNRLARSQVSGADEAAGMAREFNAMLDALDERDLELRASEEALRVAGNYNRSLIEASLDPLVTIGPDGKITDVNTATEEATGRSRKELVGTDFSDYFTEPEKAKAGYQRAFREGMVRDYPLELRHIDGPLTSVLYNAAVYRDKNEKVIGVFAAARDVTELQQAEEKLRHLAAIVESSDDAIIGKTLDEQILSWNKGAERIYGYTAREIVGRPISILVPKDLREELDEIMGRLVKGEGIEHFETVRVRKDGQAIQVALTISPIRDAYGKIVGASTIARDITDRKRAEDALRESEARYRTLVESSPYCIHEIDVRGRLNTMNRAGLLMMGVRDESEIRGGDYLAFVADTDRERIGQILDLALQGRSCEFEFNAANGRLFQSSLVPIKDGNGAVLRLMGLTHDITERKQAEEEIRKLNAELEQRVRDRTRELAASEEQHRLLFETALQGVVYQDAGGKIISMNPAAVRILGRTPEEFVGRTPVEEEPRALHEDGSPFPGNEHPAMTALRTGREVRDVVMGIFNPREGVYRWISVNAVPLFRPGETSASQVYTMFDDITGRKQADDKIRQLNEQLAARAQSLEQANKELESFSYSVSHDLRAPLRAIDGFSRIVLEDCGSRLDGENRGNLERVRAASQRMGQLIDDILQLSRLTRSEMRRVPVDLSALARTVADELQTGEPERRVEFVIHPDLVANADAGLARVVLENLLGNAWKFTGKQTGAKIEFGRMIFDGTPAFFVRDNGVGFNMAYANKLFGAFQRLHSTAEFAGTGIGLATVQRVIHRHNGRVWAEGNVGHGATFYFTLPA